MNTTTRPTVKRTMVNKLISIPMGTSVHEASLIMAEKRIRHLPIYDAMDDIVGVISQRDISRTEDLRRIPVEYVMSSPVRFIDQDASLRSAVFKMLENKISCLLVADSNEDAVGIITTDDLLGYLAQLLPDEGVDAKAETNIFNIYQSKTMQTIGQIGNELAAMGI